MQEPEQEQIINSLEALKVYFDPVRLRIMQELGEPRTVHEVAEILKVPFTRLYYQFSLLEKHRFIRVVKTRALSGAVEEKFYQVTAHFFTVDRALLMVGPVEEDDGFEVVLRTVLDDTRRDIRKSARDGQIDMTQRPPHPKSMLLKRGMYRLTAEAAERLHLRLRELLAEFQDESAHSSPGDAAYALVLSLYPTTFLEGVDIEEGDDAPPDETEGL